MSSDYESSDEDYLAAVAAAGYAIYSLDESKPLDQNKNINDPDKPLNETRRKSEDSWILPQFHQRVPSDETPRRSFEDPDMSDIDMPMSQKMPEKAVDPAPSIENTSSSDSDETDSNKSGNNNPALEKAKDRAPPMTPPMKRPPTFADKHLYIGESEIPENAVSKSGPEISMADAWEKEEMASIKERFLRLIAIIDNWEMKKKKKADHKLDKIKAKLEKTGAKAVQNHRDKSMKATVENWEIEKKKIDREIENIEDKLRKRRKKAVTSHRDKIKRIEEVAGGARAQADENRRNEEIKAKEKSNKIKLTGKLPPTCLCF